MAAAAILFKENSLPASGTSFCLFTLVGAALASGGGNLKAPCSGCITRIPLCPHASLVLHMITKSSSLGHSYAKQTWIYHFWRSHLTHQAKSVDK